MTTITTKKLYHINHAEVEDYRVDFDFFAVGEKLQIVAVFKKRSAEGIFEEVHRVYNINTIGSLIQYAAQLENSREECESLALNLIASARKSKHSPI